MLIMNAYLEDDSMKQNDKQWELHTLSRLLGFYEASI